MDGQSEHELKREVINLGTLSDVDTDDEDLILPLISITRESDALAKPGQNLSSWKFGETKIYLHNKSEGKISTKEVLSAYLRSSSHHLRQVRPGLPYNPQARRGGSQTKAVLASDAGGRAEADMEGSRRMNLMSYEASRSYDIGDAVSVLCCRCVRTKRICARMEVYKGTIVHYLYPHRSQVRYTGSVHGNRTEARHWTDSNVLWMTSCSDCFSTMEILGRVQTQDQF